MVFSGSWTHTSPQFTVSWTINEDGSCVLSLSKSNTSHYAYKFDCKIKIDGNTVCQIVTSTSDMDNKKYSNSTSCTARSGNTATVYVECGDTTCVGGDGSNGHISNAGNGYHTVGGPYTLYRAPSNLALKMTGITGTTASCSLSYTSGTKLSTVTTALYKILDSQQNKYISSMQGTGDLKFTGLTPGDVYQLKSQLSDGQTTLEAESYYFRTFKSIVTVKAIDSQCIQIQARSNRGKFYADGGIEGNGYENPTAIPDVKLKITSEAKDDQAAYSKYITVPSLGEPVDVNRLYYRSYVIENWCDGITDAKGNTVTKAPLKLSVGVEPRSYNQFDASMTGEITNNTYDGCTIYAKLGGINCSVEKLGGNNTKFIATATGLDSGTKYTGIITIKDNGNNVARASTTLTTRFPNVKIWDGEKWLIAEPYIWDGTKWVRSKAYVHDGTNFVESSYYS